MSALTKGSVFGPISLDERELIIEPHHTVQCSIEQVWKARVGFQLMANREKQREFMLPLRRKLLIENGLEARVGIEQVFR